MDTNNYDEAIKRFSDALTLDPTNQSGILVKRSEVQAVMGSWEEALIDADKVWNVFHVTSNGH
jgi:tetratricopeptide (TPR) repeat protein